ncbi:MAG: YdcF family protein [Planctomycetes bacterium]|nr:YdcF family protein [Planctomycetota bacterium]
MWRWIFFISRPFGVALGLFILLNLALGLKEPRLSANRMWFYIPLEEPWLSAFASLLALNLLSPHSWRSSRRFRLLQLGVLAGFMALTLAHVIGFYHWVEKNQIRSYAAFPFSLVILAILAMEFVRILGGGCLPVRLPRPARRFFGSMLVAAACFVMIVAHIYTFGLTDYSPAARAEAAVVLGAKVYPDGRLSNALEDRMKTGIQVFRDRKLKYLILSGGIDPNGLSEPREMKKYALKRGVPAQAILLDEQGNNTYLSARNCRKIAGERGFRELIVVSQYFHNARVKLIFERSGIPCYTMPAEPSERLVRDNFWLFREAVAYPYYLVFYQ